MKKNKKLINNFEKLGTKIGILIFTPINLFFKKNNNDKNRILFIKYCCFGDAILSLYGIRKYKALNPHIELDILCSHRVKAVYEHSNLFNHVYSLPITGTKGNKEVFSFNFFKNLLSIIKKLRTKKYNELIDLELYRMSAMLFKAMLNIPRSRGFEVQGAPTKNHNFTIVRKIDDPEWKVFFKLLDVPLENERDLNPLFDFQTKPKLKEIGMVFGSSPNWPQKKWPLNYFIRLLNQLNKEGYHISLFGSDHEREEATIMQQSIEGKLTNWVGELDYSNLIKELSKCNLVIGNDTGPMHLAAAGNIQTVTLFGPTNPEKWKPIGGEALFLPELKCRPCYYLSHMPFCSHMSCLNQLNPEKVTQFIFDKLNSE